MGRRLGVLARNLRGRPRGPRGEFPRDQLMDSIAEAVLVLAADRSVVDLNAAALRLAGSPAEWQGRSSDALFPFLAGAAIAGATAATELIVENGDAVYDVRVSRARADRAVWIVMLRDVTDAHRTMRAREQFVVQNSELVARVSHELRTPLTTIRGAIELLLGRGDTRRAAEEHRLLQKALQGCERMARIVHEILDLTSIEDARDTGLQPLPVERLIVDSLLDLGRVAAAKGVRLSTSVEQGLAPVIGDHDRLVQALGELVSKSIDRAPAASIVTVSAWREDDRDEPRVTLAIRDDGTDITKDHLDAAAGQALAIARALIEQQGGRLTADSAAGATFVISLRSLKRARQVLAAPAAPRTSRILVADDDSDLRDIVSEALRGHGFEVVEVEDGRAASEALARDLFDAAVLDITMPHQHGDEVIRRLRAGTRQPELPVVVLTGTIDERLTPASLGANALLTKPANLARLITEVKGLLSETRTS